MDLYYLVLVDPSVVVVLGELLVVVDLFLIPTVVVDLFAHQVVVGLLQNSFYLMAL